MLRLDSTNESLLSRNNKKYLKESFNIYYVNSFNNKYYHPLNSTLGRNKSYKIKLSDKLLNFA